MYEDNDFGNPKTDWGFVIGKILKECKSPFKIHLRDFEVIVVDPSYYTAWESDNFWICEDSGNLYFILNIQNDFINPISFKPEHLTKMRKECSLQILLTSCNYRILASTEHGLDDKNLIFADLNICPGLYNIDLYVEKNDYPEVVIYKFDLLKA
ncbi:hypothetical protein SAMN05421780_101101 [Flexibacter flexilis DSM 6793]|uniref:Uncharacterized protein n=1 Tax=Flexibacter flexilis DSM 6793 TaxID=927664 RepID=A0A1I1DB54_9BACT|nr:hypothetical protein [Flexibacter flexilis]SFB72249.1 hypothetical protein SAMN05421780_101101 [Flexibacter flexilis DSM 6793]